MCAFGEIVSKALTLRNCVFTFFRTALYCTITALWGEEIALFLRKNAFSNVVGYNEKETPTLGSVMAGGTFISVDSSKGFKLSDLAVTGYEEDGGCWGDFYLNVLDASGRNEVSYCWFDDPEGDPVIPAGWYDSDGAVPYDSKNITFEAGQGFWIQGKGYKLQASGQVNSETVLVKTPTLGSIAISNPFPTPITLGDMSVTGYEEDGGCWGDFYLNVLDASGRNEVSYCWFDDPEGDPVILAGWYDSDGAVPFDSTTSFSAGQGFWVQGKGMTLNFDKLDF